MNIIKLFNLFKNKLLSKIDTFVSKYFNKNRNYPMEILFKNNMEFYFIEDDKLDWNNIGYFPNIDLSNIKPLDDAEILYYYIDPKFNIKMPVYYEHNGKFITKYYNGIYGMAFVDNHLTKDYTLVNSKLLDNI